MTWQIDWTAVRSWIITLGGLSGFASLGWNAYEKRRSQRREQEGRLRLTVTREQPSGALLVVIRFTPDNHHQAHSAFVELLEPEGAVLIEATRQLAVGRGGEFVENWAIDSVLGERSRTVPLTRVDDKVVGAVIANTASFLVYARLRITIWVDGRAKSLVSREFEVSA